jgi:ubiquinone biosynthesis protein COQ4
MMKRQAAGSNAVELSGELRLPRPRVRPIRALRAFRRLLADKEDTRQVFEIMQALNGASTARGYQRLLGAVQGGRLAYERVELAERLSDRAYLQRLPEGSVGAAYRRFIAAERLSAGGLAEESRKARGGAADLLHPYAWFGRRIRDTHDIWHVLTGYGRDSLGELCLVAFSYAQTGALGWAFIALGGVIQALKIGEGTRVAGAVWQAYCNGRDAAWLPGEDYEVLLLEPLEDARRRLRIRRGDRYFAVPPPLRDRPRDPGRGQASVSG